MAAAIRALDVVRRIVPTAGWGEAGIYQKFASQLCLKPVR